MAQYKTGAVSVTQGSHQVTGIGTQFVGEVVPGDDFWLLGSPVHYQVATVDSANQITLSAPFAQASAVNAAYSISRDFTPFLELPEVRQGDTNVLAQLTQSLRKIDAFVGSMSLQATGPAGPVVASSQAEADALVAAGNSNVFRFDQYMAQNPPAWSSIWFEETAGGWHGTYNFLSILNNCAVEMKIDSGPWVPLGFRAPALDHEFEVTGKAVGLHSFIFRVIDGINLPVEQPEAMFVEVLESGTAVPLTPAERAAAGEAVQLCGLDNGSNLPGVVLQAQIDALIAAGWPAENIGWWSTGTETLQQGEGIGSLSGVTAAVSTADISGVGVVLGTGALAGVSATTSVSGMTGVGVQIGQGAIAGVNSAVSVAEMTGVGIAAGEGTGSLTGVSAVLSVSEAGITGTGVQVGVGSLTVVLATTSVNGITGTGVQVGQGAFTGITCTSSVAGITGSVEGVPVVVYDDFNRANGALGGDWTVTSGSVTISANTAYGVGVANHTTAMADDQYCEADLITLSSPAQASVHVRCNLEASRYMLRQECYYDEDDDIDYSNLKLYRYTYGVGLVELASCESTLTVRVRLKAIGNTISCDIWDTGAWQNVMSVTDTAFTTGAVGISPGGGTIDNFVGGEL